MKYISKFAVAALVLSVAMSSCNIYKKFEMPTDSSEIAAAYVKARNGEADTTSFGTTPWRQVFTEPELVALIEQALANNNNLHHAKLNIDIAQAQLQGAKLAFLPSVAIAPNGSGSAYKGTSMAWTYQIPLQVSWEIDIFGRLLNGKRGAQAALLQSEEYCQAVQSQLIGSVAYCYYTISCLQSQLALNLATAKTYEKSVEVMKNLKEAGRVNESAVVQTQAMYYGVMATTPQIEQQLVEAYNSMSLLLNTMPQRWTVPMGSVLTTPAGMNRQIAVSHLAGRPDVRAAEQGVALAYYAVNQARSNFYPSLNISANGGFTNLVGDMITNPGKFFIQLAGQLTAPLFMRGQNISTLKITKAQQEQAMKNFEYSIYNASAEVSNAMSLYDKTLEEGKMLDEQTFNLEKAVEYTMELLLYDGTSTYLEVIISQQNLLNAQRDRISNRLTQSQAVINLYQSLGGGK